MSNGSNPRLALVFGGSRGIGAAIVGRLQADGFDVTYTYQGAAPGAPARGGVHPIQADIRDDTQVAAAFAALRERHDRGPDCVILNAGINVPAAPLASMEPEHFHRLVDVNIIGAFNVLQEAARQIEDKGTIIGLTTSLVRHAVPGVGAYSATKAAVECLLRSMQKELAPRGVRVNGVAPGPTDTDLFRAGKDEAALARAAAMSVFNRVGLPQEIASVVSFLASEQSSWVAGQIIQPNGGLV